MEPNLLPRITEVHDIQGKRVLVRASLNVPIDDGVVSNRFRLERALPTIRQLTAAGARVILIAHIGREATETLDPVFKALQEELSISKTNETVGERVQAAVDALKDGEVLLLENLRSVSGEVENDDTFAKTLASYADYYVNDAFPVSHRAHASIVGIPKYLPSYFGESFLEEYTQLSKVITPEQPSLFILGGAKFETKLPLVAAYTNIYEHIFIGGALANDLFRAKGYEIGTSTVSETEIDFQEILSNERILLPVDVVVSDEEKTRVTTPDDVRSSEKILDAGPKTIELLASRVKDAQTILWNGPLGYYEGGFVEGTKLCAELIAKSDAYSVVGGGNTIDAIESLGLSSQFSFLSTAGGAMLMFLEEKTLLGIEAVLKKENQV